MGIDILVGAFPHHGQHQLRQAEEFESCPIQRFVGLTIKRIERAVQGLACEFAHLGRIVPVDTEDHALGLDLALDLLSFRE
jgi:hypothetical protein